ncbi:hypothetical protein IGI04_008144 [Brassica rapa subsp. trilocularis]|uniref:Uncharacterized protein n=1 Tax=Brassica rapa subsp. trilocularis TaxID=1813537 RepID=A0ABQ7NLZ6_BRACM|nr:hypothetical protein IGI04_008144 [Brassica rapa subsp. trilocularis]
MTASLLKKKSLSFSVTESLAAESIKLLHPISLAIQIIWSVERHLHVLPHRLLLVSTNGLRQRLLHSARVIIFSQTLFIHEFSDTSSNLTFAQTENFNSQAESSSKNIATKASGTCHSVSSFVDEILDKDQEMMSHCRDIRCSMGGNGIIALVRVVVSLVIIVFLLVGILANAAQSVPSTEKVKSLRFSGKDVNLFHVSKRKVPNGADPIHNRKETSRQPPRV